MFSLQLRRPSLVPLVGSWRMPSTTWTVWRTLPAGAGTRLFLPTSIFDCLLNKPYRIYIIEGIITIVFGLACYYLVPSSFENAYFFNNEDKEIMRHRAELTHQYSGGSGHFKMRDIWIAVKDPKTWCHGWIQFCVITPLYGTIF